MSETLEAASSPAEVDVFNGEQPSLAEYSQYRESGELPERFKPAEIAAPAPVEEKTEGEVPESVPDSEPEQQQEKDKGKPKGKTAEDRIAQLEATIERIKRGAGLERKTEVAPVTEQPKAPESYADYRKSFKASEWIAEYAKQNPEAAYEDATAAMADHLADVRDQFRSIEQQRQAQTKELNDKVADARARYGEKFDEVLRPTLDTIVSNARINPNVKAMINDSEVVADLIFTIGSDQKTLDSFVAMAETNPGKALRYIAIVENGIVEELAGQGEEKPRDEAGKFTASPAKPKTSAPKPPSPVSGVSTGAFDVSDESLSPEDWMRKRNADLSKRK
jgi:hypothetical protein